jgi:(p)ppGpp synthase/HD superfamily hydrolase
MWSQDAYKRALDFAARVHGDQRVPGSGYPYVVHLTKVAMEAMAACVADPALDANVAIACALLHDSIEDAGVARSQIQAEFGAAIAAGVQALTKDSTVEKSRQMGDSLERIRASAREVWVVKLADRITNLEPPPAQWSPEKRRAYRAEAQQILDALRGASTLLETRIEEKIAAYAAYCA